MNDTIREKLKLLPGSPGVYKMLDQQGTIIYVGKAVSLKNRVRQYFQASKSHPPKVAAMVSHVVDFETILTSNETEALTLESNLIKQYQPRYNILLKDDKHFPYVRINFKQDFPRVEVVRSVKQDGAKYLGPYLSGIALRDALNVVRDHFPVRHCKKDIKKAIARRERPCLMYHVGKCCAPCTGNVTREEYHALLHEVSAFLDGNSEAVIAQLTNQMTAASDQLDFERAAKLRDHIAAIRMLQQKQTVINTRGTQQDVFALCEYEGKTLVFALFIRDGKVIGTEHFHMEAQDESASAIMASFLPQYYMDIPNIPPEILLHAPVDDMEAIALWLTQNRGKKVQIRIPQRGEGKRLTTLAYENGIDVLQKGAILERRSWERGEGAIAALCEILELSSIPHRLECYDNSHLRGQHTVSSMVVFEGGQPNRKQYRRFRIKSDTGGDDLAAMREVLTRRFQHAADGDERFGTLPDLLIVDGGTEQLKVAVNVLSTFGLDHIPVIGLAERNEQLYVPDQDAPITLPRHTPALQLLQRIRDEAHRFAITYHRSLRQKNALFSKLDEIPGIGAKRKRVLFDAFTTLDNMKDATLEELAALPGMGKAAALSVYNHFHKEA